MSFWTKIRDKVEGGAVEVLNYVYPGSSLVTSNLVSKGAQDMLKSTIGQIGLMGGGVAGGMNGNLGNYTSLLAGSAPSLNVNASIAAADKAAMVDTIMQNSPGITAEQANAAAQSYAQAGYTPGQLADAINSENTIQAAVKSGELTSSQADEIRNGVYNASRASAAGAPSTGWTDTLSSAAKSFINNTPLLAALAQGATSMYGANLAADSARNATQEATRQFNIGQANQAPWLAAGRDALGASLDLQGLPGGTTGNPNNQLAALQSAPGYQFRKQLGDQAFNAMIGKSGGMTSGKAYTGAIDWNQNFASNEYGNRLNQLAGLSGTGQAQANNMANQGAGYGQMIGNSGLIAGQLTQSGITGAGNALASYLNPPKNYRFDPVTGQMVAA